VGSGHRAATNPVTERSDNISGFLYEGRYARIARLLALAVITGTAFIGHPRPSWTGDGLVILISLLVAVASQVATTIFPSGRWVLARTIVAAVSCGVLVGYDPAVGTAILLIFVGLDAGASLDIGPGAVVTGMAVVTTAIATLASGQATDNVSLGSVVVIGFLAAAGRKQYMLRADQAELRLVDAERAQEEHARAAGLAERANAAREIHDILAHSLGALVLQLDALDSVLTTGTPDHERAIEILARARALAVEGLNEARQAVGTLRTDAPPLVDALRQLVETTGSANLEITGTPRPTSAELSVALRRTAQEALTNASKHAPGAAPTVQLAFTPAVLVLTVTDTGCPEGIAPSALADTGGGYGIEGLRERAELIGGTLEAGPLGPGWQVRLSVPDDQHRRAADAT
jgi:signal transduction histidine kinase